MAAKYTPVWIILASTLVAAAVLGLLHHFSLDERLVEILQWLDGQDWKANLLFVLIMALAMVLLAPGIIFTMGAGFVFGVVKGSVMVIAGSALGAVAAFLIARYLFGPRPSRWLMSQVKHHSIVEIIQAEGWRIVMYTRLVPFFPAKISNYFFGLTPVRLRDFALGNFLGIIPYTVNNVYLGSIASDITNLGHGQAERTPVQWAFYALGFILAVTAVVALTRMARRVLAQKLEESGMQPQDKQEEK